MITRKEHTLLIHQLTDVHAGALHYKPSEKIYIPTKNRGITNLVKYSDYLKNCFYTNPETLPDLLIIAGDFTSYAHKDEFELVEKEIRIIKDLLTKKERPLFYEDSPYILIVPGNHDLEWNKSSYKEKIKLYAKMADSLYDNGKVLSAVYNENENNQKHVSFDFGDGCNIFVYLFNTTSLVGIESPKHQEMYKLFSQLYSEISQKESSDLNSFLEYLQNEIKKDPGYICPDDIGKMTDEIRGVHSHRIKMAIMHHNLSGIPTGDLENFDTIVHAGLIKQSLMNHGFDLVFHGHRHFLHCCYERFLPNQSNKQGMFILGGEALGKNEKAPFLEVKLYGTDKAHLKEFPACRLTVNSVEHMRGRYQEESRPLIDEIIDSPIYAEVISSLGRTVFTSDKERLLEHTRVILEPLQKLESELVYWGEESSTWIRDFHTRLEEYSRIYATDIYSRSSIDNPLFNKYLREQYTERLKSLNLNYLVPGSNRYLSFSPDVYKAIIRTGWQPNKVVWGECELKEATRASLDALEIVRILIRPKATQHDLQELENLDYDHKLCAIPLFVLDPQQLQLQSIDLSDFAIGFNNKGVIVSCYEFNENEGKVSQVRNSRHGWDLSNIFEDLLKNPSLKTVNEFLGYGNMIEDHEELKSFAEDYDKTRKASTTIINVLRNNLCPGPNKVGLDIGCGTGNYTIPLIEDFGKIIGLDISEEMLNKAKEKAGDKVEWLPGDALCTNFEDEYFDAIWLISTLHYFTGERQKYLFKEIYRILKPGGVVVADIEFEEQFDSLWLVEFFPSLKDRYKNSCLSKEIYKGWLNDIGFIDIKFEFLDYCPTENDKTLRIGQHDPTQYLDMKILNGIPAFKQMKVSELSRGLEELEIAIKNKKIDKITDKYEQNARMKGDVGIIIATRQ